MTSTDSHSPIALLAALLTRVMLEGEVRLPAEDQADAERLRFSMYNTIRRVKRQAKTATGEVLAEMHEIIRNYDQVQIAVPRQGDSTEPVVVVTRTDRTATASRLMAALTQTEAGQAALRTLAERKREEVDAAVESQAKFLERLGIAPEAGAGQRVEKYKVEGEGK